MQDPLREIPSVCKGMLNPEHQLEFGRHYLTDDVRLVHPQMLIKGRTGFLAAYQLWAWLNRGKATFNTADIMYSSENKVTVRGHTMTHLILLPAFRLEFYIELSLADGPDGKLISQQHDHLLVLDTFVYQLPFVGIIMQKYIPQLSGIVTVAAMQTVGSTLNWLGIKTPLGKISPETPGHEAAAIQEKAWPAANEKISEVSKELKEASSAA